MSRSVSRLFTRQTAAIPRRGVHLDLKGNPPTPRRLLELLDLFAALRLDTVLVEWEDTFPWTCAPEMRSPTAYTPAMVTAFHARATALGLEIIPLVQCFGHAENVLSRKRFRHLRERPADVSEFCASQPGSARIVQAMVDDVLRLSGGNVRRFHLGGDEARHMGTCPRCRRAVRRLGRDGLYLAHVGPVLDLLARRTIRPILWDDMMRRWPRAGLMAMARRADLMAWSYGDEPVTRGKGFLTEEHLKSFARAGVTTWAASAYKGGDGAWIDRPDTTARLRNNLGWIPQARARRLAGMVMTAWSRYDTFMSPCETIEASLDMLVCGAAAMWDGTLPREPQAAADRWLGRWRGGRELRRFRACSGAARALGDWSRSAVDWALTEAERAAHRNGEPRRNNPAQNAQFLGRIRQDLVRGPRLGAAFVRAHRGAIPRRWLDLYVQSRTHPFRRRARAILARS